MTNLRDEVLITADALAARVLAGEPVVILAIRSDDSTAPQPYATAPRLPGAFDATLAEDFADRSDPERGSRPLPSLENFSRRVRAWGITSRSLVVVYDHDGNLQAARAWWVLRWAGVPRVHTLDGGFQSWIRAGLDVTSVLPAMPPASDIVLAGDRMPQLDADQAAALARSGVLLDSRMVENYAGGESPPGAPKRGHIPGAVSLPAAANLDAAGCFAAPGILRALYERVGALAGVPTGVYCGAGVSAAHDVAALATLGVTAPMYVGSWSAWSADPQRPAAIGMKPG